MRAKKVDNTNGDAAVDEEVRANLYRKFGKEYPQFFTWEYLDRASARLFLSKCKTRITERGLEVLYRRKWLDVSSTDFLDDVCVEVNTKSVKVLARKAVFGARVRGSGTFSVIDKISDG